MKHTLLLLSLVFFLSSDIYGQIPRMISYQGDLRTSQGSPVPDGQHYIVLSIYNTLSGGSPLYKETELVAVAGGIFTCMIGGAAPLPPGLTFDSAYFLGISVDQGTEMSPRTPFTSVPYALHAQVADGLTANAVIPPGLIIGSTAPSGPAFGDLWGTYPSPMVVGLQSRPISTLLPNQGDIFMWSGSTWGPQTEPIPIAFHLSGNKFFPGLVHNFIQFSKSGAAGLFDDGHYYDTANNTFTVPKTGVYRFDMHYDCAFGVPSQFIASYSIALTIDGKITGQQDFASPTLNNGGIEGALYSALLKLTVGQVVQVIIWQVDDPKLTYISADLTVFKLN